MDRKSIFQIKYAGIVLVLALITAIPTVCAAAGKTNCDFDQIVVPTDKGLVAGLQTETMNKFLGIPYAAPPTGELRWKPPQQAAPWHGLLDATKFANHCPQVASPFGVESTNENCLYLNVYTPADHECQWGEDYHGHPVMVWIHGGALVVGESDDYDPTKLVEQDVIVVTFNYRLGFLGFLAHPALSDETSYGGSGDYGFMDQQAALDWVRHNIRYFGGNPDNVTIFGESAGGLSVHTQLASPRAAGLFQRAIVESGAYFLNTTTLADAEAAGTLAATAMGCLAPQTAACLRGLSVGTLLASEGSDLTGNVDNYVLTQPIDSALLTGQFNRVPVMEGSNHDEWRLFVALDFELPTGKPTSAINYSSWLDASFGGALSALGILSDVEALYPPNTPPYPPPAYSIAFGAAGTDGIFACNSRLSIRSMAKHVPTFAYEFNDQNAPELYLPPDTISGMPYGAAHASELQYIWNLPQSPSNPLSLAQQRLSGNMVKYWTQFARFGNPSSFFTPFWPQYDPTKDQFQSLVPPSPYTESGFNANHNCSSFWTFGN
ncbi:MAG: carboxylesterase/lipase family protein [Syntrophobacteraceae bacterium]